MDRLCFPPKRWKAVKAKSTLICFSDHCHLTVQAEIEGQSKRGRGAWKLNMSLLEDEKTQWVKQCYTGWRTLRAGYWNTEWWAGIKERTKVGQQLVSSVLEEAPQTPKPQITGACTST